MSEVSPDKFVEHWRDEAKADIEAGLKKMRAGAEQYWGGQQRLFAADNIMVLVRTHGRPFQLQLPGMTDPNCRHIWSPNRPGHMACVDCGAEMDLERLSMDGEEPAFRAPDKPAVEKRTPKLDKKTGRPKLQPVPEGFPHAPGCPGTPPEGSGACCLLEQVRIDAERSADAIEAEEQAKESADSPAPSPVPPARRRRGSRAAQEPAPAFATSGAPF